ncbi:MAG TPA: SRPBCC domain-containing protein [Solirubrobacteraceae bacterium]|nr:SRPBCC domain-containing protein [Solirubrobacteraceae bacterium]
MDAGHCELRLTRRYDASPEEVWAALTEPDSIGRWLARPVELELTPGGAFTLANGVDARIRELEPGRLLALEWGHAREERSIVHFELHAEVDGNGTILTLEHGRIHAPLGMRYLSRWTSVLDRVGAEVAA